MPGRTSARATGDADGLIRNDGPVFIFGLYMVCEPAGGAIGRAGRRHPQDGAGNHGTKLPFARIRPWIPQDFQAELPGSNPGGATFRFHGQAGKAADRKNPLATPRAGSNPTSPHLIIAS